MAVNNLKIFGGPIKTFELLNNIHDTGSAVLDIGAIGEISIKLEPLQTKAYNSKMYTRLHKLTIEGPALQVDNNSFLTMSQFSASDAHWRIKYADETEVSSSVSGAMPISFEVSLEGGEDSDHSFNFSGVVVGKIEDLLHFRD